MGAYSSVACNEVFGSFNESADIQSGLSFTVGLQCAASNRFALMEDLLTTPRYYPSFTGYNVYAVNCVATPMPNDATGGSYSSNQQWYYGGDALVTVNYSTIITDIASESIEPSIDNTPLSHLYFNWGGTSAPVMLLEGEAPAAGQRILNLVQTQYRIAVIPTDVLAAVNCVNLYAYTSSVSGLTFPAGTLLYLPSPYNRSFATFTNLGYTLTLKFAYKPQGWNKFWRAQTQQFESIYLNGSNTPYNVYTPYDFSDLLA